MAERAATGAPALCKSLGSSFCCKTEFNLVIHFREEFQHKGHPRGGETLAIPAHGTEMGWVCHLPKAFQGKLFPWKTSGQL